MSSVSEQRSAWGVREGGKKGEREEGREAVSA